MVFALFEGTMISGTKKVKDVSYPGLSPPTMTHMNAIIPVLPLLDVQLGGGEGFFQKVKHETPQKHVSRLQEIDK